MGSPVGLESERSEALVIQTNEYNDCFNLEGDPLRSTSVLEHVVDTVPGTKPINVNESQKAIEETSFWV